jgi:hypothetical protein
VVRTAAVAAAVPSPDGHQLLLSDQRYDGLSVLIVATGAETALVTTPHAGFRALWVDDDSVASRDAVAPFSGRPLLQISARTGALEGPFVERPKHVVAQTADDTIVVSPRVDDQGTLVAPRVVSPTDDRCFAPQSRGDVLVFQCLGSGVWLRRWSTGAAWRLGAGAQPALAHDGGALAFLVSLDDGHTLTAGDVVVVDVGDGAGAPVGRRLVTEAVERAPALSDARADGSRVLAWLVDDTIVVATLPAPARAAPVVPVRRPPGPPTSPSATRRAR